MPSRAEYGCLLLGVALIAFGAGSYRRDGDGLAYGGLVIGAVVLVWGLILANASGYIWQVQ